MAKQRTATDRFLIGGGGSTGTGAIWATQIVIDASTYDRVLFCCSRGAEVGGTKGEFSASVYSSATSGGSYTLIAGSLGTSGTDKTNTALLLEILVPAAQPFLKIYGTATTSGTAAIPVVAVAQLYKGSRINPPTHDIAVINA